MSHGCGSNSSVPFVRQRCGVDGLISRSAAQLHLLMDRGSDQGYFHKPAKSHFIANNYEDKEVARQEFKKAGLYINCVDGIRYMGPYLGPREEKEAWVRPKVEAWTHRVRTLAKISKQYLKLAYDGLGISLQIEWQYLQSTVPGVGTLMGPIEDSLREAFFNTLFEVRRSAPNLREILGHSVKHRGLGIPDHRLLVEHVSNTPNTDSEVLVCSPLGGTELNYVLLKVCVHRASADGQK